LSGKADGDTGLPPDWEDNAAGRKTDRFFIIRSIE